MLKKYIYKCFNRLGYRIERKRTREELWENHHIYGVKNNLNLFFGAKNHIERLNSQYDNFKMVAKGKGFIVHFLDLKVYVETIEEFYILDEVFLAKDYNFHTLHNCTIIDIGANIGISSLFFSTFKNVKNVYSFEPVLDTYKQAILNFEMNPSEKIVSIKNVGLGKTTREETFIFNKYFKGNTGVRGLLSDSMSGLSNNESRKVLIENASTQLQPIVDLHALDCIVVKMDCEGAEYEIIEDLNCTGLLKRIDIIMLEWHDKGSEFIEKVLTENKFQVFSRNLGPKSGIIYGVNSK